MTLPYFDDVICAVCGTESGVSGLMSTNTFGPSDLDTRPSEMKRSTMGYWVQNCGKCGYCAADLSDESENSQRVVETAEYKSMLNDENYPILANYFRCKSLINEADGNYAHAAWAALHGAWVCDDKEVLEQSLTCRINAIRLLKKAEDNKDEFSHQAGVADLVLIDMLRRVGNYEEAYSELTKRQFHIDDPNLLRILIYQSILIGKQDRLCHTIPVLAEDD